MKSYESGSFGIFSFYRVLCLLVVYFTFIIISFSITNKKKKQCVMIFCKTCPRKFSYYLTNGKRIDYISNFKRSCREILMFLKGL